MLSPCLLHSLQNLIFNCLEREFTRLGDTMWPGIRDKNPIRKYIQKRKSITIYNMSNVTLADLFL